MRRKTFKGTLKEINATRHRWNVKKRITAGRLRKYFRIIHRTEKKYGPHYLASDHTFTAKGFSNRELNPIMFATERSGYVKATKIGLKLTARGRRAMKLRMRKK